MILCLCPVCGQRASAMTLLTAPAVASTYEAVRYVNARDVCIAAWRPNMAPEPRSPG